VREQQWLRAGCQSFRFAEFGGADFRVDHAAVEDKRYSFREGVGWYVVTTSSLPGDLVRPIPSRSSRISAAADMVLPGSCATYPS
jgi:hypothetical protein